jgi:ATP-binding cassette subfamily F protein uup
VRALSGGERNRLLLARLFTRPANVLVLDEPTNDLDLETLELVEAQLVEWPGTLLIVSHDRAFLDNIITSTFVFEGDGRVGEYVGGYTDWLRQRSTELLPNVTTRASDQRPSLSVTLDESSQGIKKLSYREQQELQALPARIELLEAEQRGVEASVAAPEFYKEPAAAIATALERVQTLKRELGELYSRWDALDSRSK